jgi:hypothetical protein
MPIAPKKGNSSVLHFEKKTSIAKNPRTLIAFTKFSQVQNQNQIILYALTTVPSAKTCFLSSTVLPARLKCLSSDLAFHQRVQKEPSYKWMLNAALLPSSMMCWHCLAKMTISLMKCCHDLDLIASKFFKAQPSKTRKTNTSFPPLKDFPFTVTLTRV